MAPFALQSSAHALQVFATLLRSFHVYAGDRFIAKQADNKRKKKLKKVEEKMLGWGRF